MLTLLIDNYDSFTLNLIDLIPSKVIVIRNNAESFSSIYELIDEVDNVIISPGPGDPSQDSRLLTFIEDCKLPLLGVCLGHQAIAAAFGGSVDKAPTPVHGQIASIQHNNSPLFRNVPSPFQAVRYHSLVVGNLPTNAKHIAFCKDLTMALQLNDSFMFGVQFHPESVCSSYGNVILENFMRISSAAAPKLQRTIEFSSDIMNVKPFLCSKEAIRLVCTEYKGIIPDLEILFQTLFLEEEYAFWLDTSQSYDVTPTYSYMGTLTENGFLLSYDASSKSATIASLEKSETFKIETQFLKFASSCLPSLSFDFPFPFKGGFVGHVNYEMKTETLPDYTCNVGPAPHARLLFTTEFLVYDHSKGRLFVVSREGTDWLENILQKISECVSVSSTLPNEPPITFDVVSKEAYEAKIQKCKEHIIDGDSYELCLTTILKAEHSTCNPLEFAWNSYRKLRLMNGAPFGSFLKFRDKFVLSSSPERFLSVCRKHDHVKVSMKPIKGTRRRSKDFERDALIRTDLETCIKDRAENLMIVDLIRNDLMSVSESKSVSVDKLMHVESFATVHQLVSTVTSKLKGGFRHFDVLNVTFPPGSMTGAPKKKTVELLDILEDDQRGVYSGVIGYFSLDGECDLSVVIRTAVMHTNVDCVKIFVGAGGAITILSDEESEYQEMKDKAHSVLQAFQ